VDSPIDGHALAHRVPPLVYPDTGELDSDFFAIDVVGDAEASMPPEPSRPGHDGKT
jgi:hypothetical protein